MGFHIAGKLPGVIHSPRWAAGAQTHPDAPPAPRVNAWAFEVPRTGTPCRK